MTAKASQKQDNALILEEARAFAKEFVEDLKPTDMTGRPGALRQHFEQIEPLLRREATDPEAELIFNNHLADAESWELAGSIIATQLRLGFALNNRWMRLMAAAMLSKNSPFQQDGRPSNWERDFHASQLMLALKKRFGIPPTRNPASTHTDSGADIAAEALNSLKFGVTPAGLFKVWERRKELGIDV